MYYKLLVIFVVMFVFVLFVMVEIDMLFVFDWKFEGLLVLYFLVVDNGYFVDVGLDVEIVEGVGLFDVILKVVIGVFLIGFVDINLLMCFFD